MSTGKEKQMHFPSAAAWRTWLETNHDSCDDGLFMVFYKKHTGRPCVSYNDAVETAICFGWIDGLLRSIDADSYKLRFTPRRKNSLWSDLNKRRALRLIKEGKMTPAGLAKIAEAKKNGKWQDAYSSRKEAEMPPDLAAALKKNKKALKNFESFPNSAKFNYIYWLNSAKRDETRAKRISEIVARAAENKKPGMG